MGDLISRAVRAAIEDWKNDFKGYVNALNIPRDDYKGIMAYIDEVPSAQPGQRNARVFQGIIVEYPSISAYPEYEGKPYFSIKYTENGQEFIGYGTYKPEVLSEFLKEYFMPPTQPGWIPCSRELPKKDGDYLVTTHSGQIARYIFIGGSSEEYWRRCATAWMPLPTPYREGRQNE